jgi:hypothetical protein
MAPRVTFLVPVRTADDLRAPALESLVRQERADSAIQVLGLGCGPEPPAALAQAAPEAAYLGVPPGTRLADALNRGLLTCESPLVAIVDPELELAPDWLAVLLDAMAFDLETYMICGRIVSAGTDGHRLEAVGEGVDELGGRFPVAAGAAEDAPEWLAAREVFGPSPGAVLIRRKLFSFIGPFDGAFGAGSEFADLAFRARWLGLKCVYVPAARAARLDPRATAAAEPGATMPGAARAVDGDRLRLFFKCMPPGVVWVNAPRALMRPLLRDGLFALPSSLWFLAQFVRGLPGLMSRRREVFAQVGVTPETIRAWLSAEPSRSWLHAAYRVAVEAMLGPQAPGERSEPGPW